MTARGVGFPLALVALGLTACAEQQNPTAAAPQSAPTESGSTQPVRTASADDPDAQARDDGYASAAEQARARAYGEPPAEQQQPEQR
jgi:hypothetical protein